jgi:hypothetical protein
MKGEFGVCEEGFMRIYVDGKLYVWGELREVKEL